MPEEKTIKRAHKAKREGKSPSTQAGEFVHEEIAHIRERKTRRTIRQASHRYGTLGRAGAGVKLPPPPKGRTSKKTRKPVRDVAAGKSNCAHVGKTLPCHYQSAVCKHTNRFPCGTLSKQTKSAAQKEALPSASVLHAGPFTLKETPVSVAQPVRLLIRVKYPSFLLSGRYLEDRKSSRHDVGQNDEFFLIDARQVPVSHCPL